jgi:glycerol-3-phosphate dehydrogenase
LTSNSPALTFSAIHREDFIKALKGVQFDLIVIGGGITGCGIALDAASRGLKVALLEKSDFAYGTSSRSTKLIHGGLRYLKQLEFGLVKEVGSERAVVHGLAPHLVVPEKMLLPLYEKRGMGYWLASVGLKIYDWLAGVKPAEQRRMLTRTQTLKAEPLLKKDDVKGGALYAEYRTDDARLTIGIAKAAFAQGALMINYVEVKDFMMENGSISGIVAVDRISGALISAQAKVVVNAAGPWVDDLRKADDSLKGKKLHLTKGVHIVVPHHRLPVRQAIYFDVQDGRMIFAIPRGRTTYVGTTDTSYTGDKDGVRTTAEDARYLLDGINNTFPDCQLVMHDIESSWAGLRPLIHEDGKSASELSRKDEIFESSTGLISIAGGKLTGYRKMAERVVNLVIKKQFGQRLLKAPHTQSIGIDSNGFANIAEVAAFIAELKRQFDLSSIPEYAISALVENFGVHARAILEHWAASPVAADRDYHLLKSQLYYCTTHEMVSTAADFLVRRTGLLYFDIQKVIRYKENIVADLGDILAWTPEERSSELVSLQRLVDEAQLKDRL